ncbi:MAG: ferrous iron transport protein A [Gemmatimonadetes bacterium]|nr:ferrous iron transport protein A [Gemmatimonadota bacterium]
MIARVRAARNRRKLRAALRRAQPAHPDLRLAEIPLREVVELVRIDLPADEMEPLLELGLLPGCRVCPVQRSLFGDPVLMVDGSLIALRREMASCLCVRRMEPATN